MLASLAGSLTTVVASPDVLATLEALHPVLGHPVERVELLGEGGGPEQGAALFAAFSEDWGYLKAALASFFNGLAAVFYEAPVPEVTSVCDLPAVVVRGFFFILFGMCRVCNK